MGGRTRWLLLVLLLLLAAAVSFTIGPAGFSPPEPVILWNIRLPHLLLGIAAGGILATVGAALQGLFGNPLIDPYTLGVANGAALGTTLGLMLSSFTSAIMPLLAILGAIATLILVLLIARLNGQLSRTGLVLAGVIVSFLLSGTTMLLMILSRRPLHEIIYLLMGNLDIVLTKPKLYLLFATGIASLIGLIALYSYHRELNIIGSDEELAATLGVSVQQTMRTIFFISSLLVGIVVAFVGAISFIGLVVPHITRLIFGPDHRAVIPGSFLLGASLLLFADVLARLTTPVLPLSVVTSFIGVPFFIYLYRTRFESRL